jgi:hypothetical protein
MRGSNGLLCEVSREAVDTIRKTAKKTAGSEKKMRIGCAFGSAMPRTLDLGDANSRIEERRDGSPPKGNAAARVYR